MDTVIEINWISVSDQLPPVNVPLEIFCRETEDGWDAFQVKDGGMFTGTHWFLGQPGTPGTVRVPHEGNLADNSVQKWALKQARNN